MLTLAFRLLQLFNMVFNLYAIAIFGVASYSVFSNVTVMAVPLLPASLVSQCLPPLGRVGRGWDRRSVPSQGPLGQVNSFLFPVEVPVCIPCAGCSPCTCSTLPYRVVPWQVSIRGGKGGRGSGRGKEPARSEGATRKSLFTPGSGPGNPCAGVGANGDGDDPEDGRPAAPSLPPDFVGEANFTDATAGSGGVPVALGAPGPSSGVLPGSWSPPGRDISRKSLLAPFPLPGTLVAPTLPWAPPSPLAPPPWVPPP